MVAVTELRLRCPDVHTQLDERVIREALANSPGIGEVDVDYVTGRLRVTTANQDHGVDVRRLLSAVGFPPEEE